MIVIMFTLMFTVIAANSSGAMNNTGDGVFKTGEDMLNSSEQFYKDAKNGSDDLPPIVEQYEKFMRFIRSIIRMLDKFDEFAKGILPGV